MLSDCFRCQTKFEPQKSTAYLRLSYCNRLCETADIGFDLEAWLRIPVKQQETTAINLEGPGQRELVRQ